MTQAHLDRPVPPTLRMNGKPQAAPDSPMLNAGTLDLQEISEAESVWADSDTARLRGARVEVSVPGPPGYLNRRIFVDLSFPSLDSVIDFAARSGRPSPSTCLRLAVSEHRQHLRSRRRPTVNRLRIRNSASETGMNTARLLTY
jgi:hypothetical protein